MSILLVVQIVAYLVLAAVALHQHRRAGRAAARIENYARRAATKWEATTGGRAAYRDIAKVARGGKGRWS